MTHFSIHLWKTAQGKIRDKSQRSCLRERRKDRENLKKKQEQRLHTRRCWNATLAISRRPWWDHIREARACSAQRHSLFALASSPGCWDWAEALFCNSNLRLSPCLLSYPARTFFSFLTRLSCVLNLPMGSWEIALFGVRGCVWHAIELCSGWNWVGNWVFF